MRYLTSIAVITHVLPMVYAWGTSGHQAVGYIAMQFLSPKALTFVQQSLGSTYNQSLGVAATWADEIRTANPWSAAMHYVDAEDNPPSSCSINQTRDCADGVCVLTAIANYTARVIDTSLSASQRQDALKFLDHFIGDIGQPLHVEAISTGGNGISVKCSGGTSNLHSVWDSALINNILGQSYNKSVTSWASALTTRILSGTYRSLASGWLSCSSTTQPAKRDAHDDLAEFLTPRFGAAAVTPLKCPLVWAAESNALDCSIVFNYTSGQDLCAGTYYNAAVPVVELQIAKQGYRLAAWLNVLFDGDTGLP